MRLKIVAISVIAVLSLVIIGYMSEPHTATFFDDGPYYSKAFAGSIAELPIRSTVKLMRFGRPIFILESRQLPTANDGVLVLKDMEGSVRWARNPDKPDGELGLLYLRAAAMTWYGGWRIQIKPQMQEGGHLYIGSFGGFRFFNHSW